MASGATASRSLFGPSFRLSQHRGEVLHLPAADELLDTNSPGTLAVVTIHPSAVLRAGDEREAMYTGLVADLRARR